MPSYDLEFSRDHAIVCFPSGLRMLLDTGSPTTMGPVPEELGNGPDKAFVPRITSADLSENVGAQIDGLLGCDILSGSLFEVDWRGAKLRLGDLVETAQTVALRLDHVMGVPVIPFEWNGTGDRAFLDTGAPISYLHGDIPVPASDEVREDFHPMLGAFKTRIGEQEIVIGGLNVRIKHGEPPAALTEMLRKSSPDVGSILGVDVFRQFRVGFDFGRRRCLLSR